ncbi:MAG: aromatic ring-hydroxylating dioxygenase subunit alpha [Lautropia sp.]
MVRIADLVRPDGVHASVYSDAAIFRLEMTRLFGRTWLLAAHHSQIPEVGDYVLSRIGDQSIIVVRQTSDRIGAFYNRCPHRGARLKHADSGSATAFVCPYHGWSFQLDGAVRFVPAREEYPAGHCDGRGLERVANVATYRGFVFVNGSASPSEPLEEFLGPMKDVIDDLVDRAPADDLEIAPALLRHRYRGNWKLTFENLNDTIHAGVAHAVAARVADAIIAREPAAAQDPMLGLMSANGKPVKFFQQLRMTTSPHGHSYFEAHMPTAYPPAIHREYFETLAGARGNAEADRILATARHLGLLYPGSTWHARYQTVRLVQPLAPDLTEVITLCFRLKGAPESTMASALGYCNGSSSPLSSVITDDLEIYEAIQRNATSGDAWLSIGRGYRPGQPDDRQVAATSEAYIRGQYAAWQHRLQEA